MVVAHIYLERPRGFRGWQTESKAFADDMVMGGVVSKFVVVAMTACNYEALEHDRCVQLDSVRWSNWCSI